MKSLNESVAKWGRRVVVAAALLFSFSALADFLWWTVDFDYNWGNPGDLTENPAGETATGYDFYLVIENTTSGDWVTTVKGGTLVNNHMEYGDGNQLQQMYLTEEEVAEFSKSEYVFFVEMVRSTETVYDTRFWSDRYSYASLVADGHVSEAMMPVEVPWNPSVGAPWSVPEPTSGLLTMLGFGFLMLRRKRVAA